MPIEALNCYRAHPTPWRLRRQGSLAPIMLAFYKVRFAPLGYANRGISFAIEVILHHSDFVARAVSPQ